LESHLKKVIVFSLLGILLLSGVGLVVHFRMFAPWERLLAEKPAGPSPAPGEMSWSAYKKTELELGSFDLVNGLTKHDLETIGAKRGLGFYYLVGCLWLAVGLRVGPRCPCKGQSRRDL
jgi:hypothetical protein